MWIISKVRSPFLPFLLALLTLVSLAAAASESARYDISYLWSRDLASVREYRDRVGRVLGPAMDRRLEVVTNGGLFGLVYHRHGDSAGAARIAREHTRLLRHSGLEAAAPVRSDDWVVVGRVPPEIPVSPQTGDSDAADRPRPDAEDTPQSRPELEPTQTADEGAAGSAQSPAEAAGPSPVEQEPVHASPPQMSNLEKAVEDYIKGLRRQGRIAPDERTGWSVYDFATGEKLVTINEDVQFQAASMIKPFVATAFFHRVERGELIYGPRSRRHMREMIQHSSNTSTDWIIRRVGGPRAVQRILQRYYGGIFRQTSIVEYIPRNGRSYRNKASLHDYSRFLYALWKGSLPGAQEIKRLMALPGSDRIFKGVEEIPLGTHVYNKTGSTARLCGDMGILSVAGKDGRRYPYTLIGVIEKPSGADNYTAWIRSRSEVIREVSGIVYQGILAYHEG
ncbi:MAG: serine hydrolase [Chromatiales bacterium]|jgi:beta-lactamase class A